MSECSAVRYVPGYDLSVGHRQMTYRLRCESRRLMAPNTREYRRDVNRQRQIIKAFRRALRIEIRRLYFDPSQMSTPANWRDGVDRLVDKLGESEFFVWSGPRGSDVVVPVSRFASHTNIGK